MSNYIITEDTSLHKTALVIGAIYVLAIGMLIGIYLMPHVNNRMLNPPVSPYEVNGVYRSNKRLLRTCDFYKSLKCVFLVMGLKISTSFQLTNQNQLSALINLVENTAKELKQGGRRSLKRLFSR